jgi:ribosomal protein L11 methyltransferase
MSEILHSAKAFGDGTHPTTFGVLTALDAIDPAAFVPRIACDMGAGSGILTLAIARRFGCAVVAVDIERESIDTLRENVAATGLESQVMALQADGFAHSEISAQGPYDLIVMNILAAPLMQLAHAANAHLADDGVLILSGLLVWQEEAILTAYRGEGLELSARLMAGDWVTLVWQKPSTASQAG